MIDEDHGIIRDPTTGRIITKKLSSDEAREMAKRRWAKPIEADTLALLREAGYEGFNDAPTDFRLLCERAAQGDVRSIIEYGRRTGKYKSVEIEAVKPQPGEYCNLCGAYNMDGLVLGEDAVKAIWENIEEYRKKHPKGDYRWEIRRSHQLR